MESILNIFSSELIHAIGWTIIHSLWQASIIAILMSVALNVIKNNKTQLRYNIAFFAIFMVLVSALCTFIYLIGKYDPVVSTSGVYIFEGMSNADPSSLGGIHLILEKYLPMITTVWFAGVLFFLVKMLGGFWYIQKLKQSGINSVPGHYLSRLKVLKKKLKVSKPVRLLESARIKTPMVIGYLKPVILFPIGTIMHLSPQQVEAILLHELAHVKRNDFLQNIIQTFIEILFYYHPVVWYISASIRAERESCCDEVAIKLSGNNIEYAKALIEIESSGNPALAMHFGGTKHNFYNRIQRILNMPQNRSNTREKFFATLMFLLSIGIFAVANN
ncbi:MAG: M56 family metallopeptidase, partial [Bacteroidota bacterium]